MNDIQFNDSGRHLAPRKSPKRGKALGLTTALVIGGAAGAILIPAASASATSGSPHKVTICHRTASYSNPYVKITVDEASVDGNAGNDKGKGDHLLEHRGPVFYPSIPKHTEWGDIIPPFYSDGSTPTGYPSLNWNADGQAIFNNGCNLPNTPPPSTTTTSHTTPPTSTTTTHTTPPTTTTTTTPCPTTSTTSSTTTPATLNVKVTIATCVGGEHPQTTGNGTITGMVDGVTYTVKVTNPQGDVLLPPGIYDGNKFDFVVDTTGKYTVTITGSNGTSDTTSATAVACETNTTPPVTTSTTPPVHTTTGTPTGTKTNHPSPSSTTGSQPSKTTKGSVPPPASQPTTNAPTPGLVDTDGGQMNIGTASSGFTLSERLLMGASAGLLLWLMFVRLGRVSIVRSGSHR